MNNFKSVLALMQVKIFIYVISSHKICIMDCIFSSAKVGSKSEINVCGCVNREIQLVSMIEGVYCSKSRISNYFTFSPLNFFQKYRIRVKVVKEVVKNVNMLFTVQIRCSLCSTLRDIFKA